MKLTENQREQLERDESKPDEYSGRMLAVGFIIGAIEAIVVAALVYYLLKGGCVS
jgi:hypothetical protein